MFDDKPKNLKDAVKALLETDIDLAVESYDYPDKVSIRVALWNLKNVYEAVGC